MYLIAAEQLIFKGNDVLLKLIVFIILLMISLAIIILFLFRKNKNNNLKSIEEKLDTLITDKENKK